MKVTEDEKQLIGVYKQLESKKCKDALFVQAEAMLRAQDALKADYGLLGPDATLFNGVQNPLYAERNPAPMGAAPAAEAV